MFKVQIIVRKNVFPGFKGGQVYSIEGMDSDSVCVVMAIFIFVEVCLCKKFVCVRSLSV